MTREAKEWKTEWRKEKKCTHLIWACSHLSIISKRMKCQRYHVLNELACSFHGDGWKIDIKRTQATNGVIKIWRNCHVSSDRRAWLGLQRSLQYSQPRRVSLLDWVICRNVSQFSRRIKNICLWMMLYRLSTCVAALILFVSLPVAFPVMCQH